MQKSPTSSCTGRINTVNPETWSAQSDEQIFSNTGKIRIWKLAQEGNGSLHWNATVD